MHRIVIKKDGSILQKTKKGIPKILGSISFANNNIGLPVRSTHIRISHNKILNDLLLVMKIISLCFIEK